MTLYILNILLLCLVGCFNLLEKSLHLCLDLVRRPRVIHGYLFMYFVLIFTSRRGKAFSNDGLYNLIDSIYEVSGQFIFIILLKSVSFR